jgi:hypothetical protein
MVSGDEGLAADTGADLGLDIVDGVRRRGAHRRDGRVSVSWIFL